MVESRVFIMVILVSFAMSRVHKADEKTPKTLNNKISSKIKESSKIEKASPVENSTQLEDYSPRIVRTILVFEYCIGDNVDAAEEFLDNQIHGVLSSIFKFRVLYSEDKISQSEFNCMIPRLEKIADILFNLKRFYEMLPHSIRMRMFQEAMGLFKEVTLC